MERAVPPSVHIIIAEDEALAVMALQEALERAGYRVTVTHNGLRALDAERHDPADVLLTDLCMPQLGGAELIRQIRARRPGLPVVVMTGSPPPGGKDELQAQDPGQMEILIKPLDPANVVRTITTILTISS
ncbi:response regulator [Azospirillum rugosum]|uniref:CheY-like chemotaxis protein n=1 Tax=Azospirillum rugosum TaxID=416170 RepID=A0ABS4SS81_9PROT|nr:response regulator [Azospirillum rugosum]MBP2295419.1 CheY-like chemotaxis protein [Azospirillum rugosum]MDQ0528794.1 CheY-like chemotaxis protein [Azospirillum rugosum]